MADREYSIIEFFGADNGHRCGYCKTSDGSHTDGMWAHILTVQDYQDLIDRGWRRSGCYCYKPRMETTCCPQYTIKCEALNFQMSKSQKKVVKRLNKYLADGLKQKDAKCEGSREVDDQVSEDLPDLSEKNQATLSKLETARIKSYETTERSTEGLKSELNETTQESTEVITSLKIQTAVREGGPCKKAKLMRKERRLEKLQKKGIDPSQVIAKHQPQSKSLEEFLQPPENPTHRLEIKLVRSWPSSDEFNSSKTESFNIYRKYQIKIHNDKPDSITEKQFLRFLVNSPLESRDSSGVSFGSFHQQYWLDGQLIGVAVLDILPYCVSSVYFYYDTDYSFLSLGTYAALQEVALTRKLHAKSPDLQFYYMGFYIHSCPKMRYKGHYTPSKLLCPVSYTWHPMEKCCQLLEVNKYCVFNAQEQEQVVDAEQVLVLYRQTAMPFNLYAKRKPVQAEEKKEEVENFARLVGPFCVRRVLLYRD